MPHSLHQIIEDKGYVLADGAMGTSLMALGMKRGEVAESWNIEHPGRVESVHDSFINAGADLILTNSFGGTRIILDRHEFGDQVVAFNVAAVKAARQSASRVERPVIICGSMGPTGQLIKPVGKLAVEEAEAAFTEQAAALAEGGVDYLWIETMSAVEEMTAAMAGAAKTGLPVIATMSFDTKGRTMMGTTPESAIAAIQTVGPKLVAFGANCGANPRQVIDVILEFKKCIAADEIIVAKANCGKPQLGPDGFSYDGTPDIMADYACLVRDAGAQIIGGCCGTSADHLQSIATALASRAPRPVPDAAKLTELLGEA